MKISFSSTSKIVAVAALSLASIGLASPVGWSANAAQPGVAPPVSLPLAMSMNRLMVAVVDDAAHGIWAGGNKTGALSASEWVEVEMNTYQLQAAATLVSIGGTGKADQGWVTSPEFQEWSRKLNDAGVSARSAVTAKNQMALRVAGDNLVDTCNACHKQFKPDVPTEGILLKRGHDY
jgi:hypothetical protein